MADYLGEHLTPEEIIEGDRRVDELHPLRYYKLSQVFVGFNQIRDYFCKKKKKISDRNIKDVSFKESGLNRQQRQKIEQTI